MQTEDSGVHPECEYDEFGFRIDRSKFFIIQSSVIHG
jgi:hypothetical protein